MADVVVFRLEAPIASFGDLAVGERRTSHRRPAASAILGLVAAALGIGRADPGHDALAAGWRIALRTDRLGAPLADFHTAQTPPQRRGRGYATRADELAEKTDLATIVSRRDHWTDAAFTVALWPSPEPTAGPDATAIAAALHRPVWAPFAGRRACPLSRPLAPRVIAAATVTAAFSAWDAAEATARACAEARGLALPAHRVGDVYALDEDFDADRPLAAAGAGLTPDRREIRRDRLVSRARWQYEPRGEILARAATDTTTGAP